MVGGCDTLTLLACPFEKFTDKNIDRVEPVSFDVDVNWMLLLPLLPDVLLSCSHEAALLIVHCAFPLIVRSAVPPSARRLISDGEAESSGVTASFFFLQPVKKSAAIRNPIIVKLFIFIFFVFIDED